jgi:hypothetical protein
LRIAVEVGNRWRLHNARQPLRFVDRQLFPLVRAREQQTYTAQDSACAGTALQHHFSHVTRCAQIVWALRQLAAEVKAAPDEVAFVPNATTGLNTVIKSIHLNAGDEVPLSTPLSCLPRVLTWERLCPARCICSTLAMGQ